jgi:DNA-binding SARP family transcriptional activator
VQFHVVAGIGVVGDDGAVLTVTAPRQRALLALLILNANRLMTHTALAQELWSGDPPKFPLPALQVVVSRLRSRLEAYGNRIVAEPGGYRLEAGPEETDLLAAEALLRDGRNALGQGEATRAASAFERALSLWGANALEGLTGFPFAEGATRRLRDLRLALVEARNDAYLLGGRHLEILADIDAFIAAEPLREHVRAQQVAALYRAGRQAEALRACDALRKSLRDELGLDLSPAMADLERQVLDQDPSLLASDAGFMTPLPAWTPEALPFVGRTAEYEQVLSCLGDAVHDGVRVVLVEGEPGVGKSRFLLHVARQVAHDAIVLPIHVDDVFSPALHAFSQVLADATLRLTDEELRVLTAGVPNAPSDVGKTRALASAWAGTVPSRRTAREADLIQGVSHWIAALSGKAPVVIVVDDLASAGTSVLHVIWQLIASTVPKRVLVIGGTRTGHEWSSPFVRAVGVLESRDLLHRITLPPLEAAEIDELLQRMHIAPRVRLVGRLHELTSGNPFLLAEMLNIGSAEKVVEQWSSPPRVRDVARQRLAELGRATAQLLEQASLFENDFTIDALAKITGTSEATVSHLVDQAVVAHVLQLSTLKSYRFSHQLLRQALVADLSASERAAGHRRIAEVLEEVGAAPAVLAWHWSASDGPDVPAKVAQYARDAGRESVRLFEPGTGAVWLQFALDNLSGDAERGPLIVELAEARQLGGDPRGNEDMQLAVRIALTSGDDDLTLQIVRASSPGWYTLPGVTTAETERVLSRALEIAPDDATRSRILARQAVALGATDPEAGERLADEAVAAARASGERRAVVESVLRRLSVSLSPQSLCTRQEMLREILEVTSESRDLGSRYFALSSAAVAAVQAADGAGVEKWTAEADAIARSYDIAPVRWSAMVQRAWQAGLTEVYEDAEQLILDARVFGSERAVSGALETSLIQRGLLRWQHDRVAQMLPTARSVFANLGTAFPGLGLLLARVLAEDEASADEARAIVTRFAVDNFAELPRGTFWSSALVLTAETALALDLAEESRLVRDLLLPFADQVAFTGIWVTAPIAYGVGVAMTACRDERAGEYLERAAGIALDLNAPMLAARYAELPFPNRLGAGERQRGL